MKRFFKKGLIISLYVFLTISTFLLTIFCLFNFGLLNNLSSIKFDKSKLTYSNNIVSIYDNENKPLENFENNIKNLSFNEIPKHTISAFISVEDKNFYNHDGVNYKRMLKALIKNVSSLKIKEGASTISQQLIKNTHLTNERTIKRKINELLLTKKLENNLTKNEIITAYLNAIYFGNGAFGINQASQRYFSKEAKELTLEESATLAGMIKSPKKYSPIFNIENCIKRRNVVLKEMLKDNKITEQEFNNSINLPINLKINKNFLGNNSYYSASVDEACSILDITEKDLILKKYKIYTYENEYNQKIIENEISKTSAYASCNANSCAMLIDNKTGGIISFCGKSDYDILSLNRQPGSTFKPIISYAPALEFNQIQPSTPILDEKIDINGYSPKNYNNVFHGWTNAKTALAKSLNIPSVKILSYVGIDNAKKFASRFNINFDAKDNGYSIALGGLTRGLKLKDLANCYQTFGNNGEFIPIGFIKEIRTPNNKLIYKHNEIGNHIMKDSTAFLITDMLKESVRNGTCKKLNINKYDIAAKTGTVGINNKNQDNSDAYNISYTPDNTLLTWFGSTNNDLPLAKEITGSNAPSFLAQNIYKKSKLKKSQFIKPESVEEATINEQEMINDKILLATDETPERYKLKAYFAKENLPRDYSTMFKKIDSFEINGEKKDNSIEIYFEANKHLWYEILRKKEDEEKVIYKINDKQEMISFSDNDIKSGNFYSYYVIAHYNSNVDEEDLKSVKSNEIKFFVA